MSVVYAHTWSAYEPLPFNSAMVMGPVPPSVSMCGWNTRDASITECTNIPWYKVRSFSGFNGSLPTARASRMIRFCRLATEPSL